MEKLERNPLVRKGELGRAKKIFEIISKGRCSEKWLFKSSEQPMEFVQAIIRLDKPSNHPAKFMEHLDTVDFSKIFVLTKGHAEQDLQYLSTQDSVQYLMDSVEAYANLIKPFAAKTWKQRLQQHPKLDYASLPQAVAIFKRIEQSYWAVEWYMPHSSLRVFASLEVNPEVGGRKVLPELDFTDTRLFEKITIKGFGTVQELLSDGFRCYQTSMMPLKCPGKQWLKKESK